ncbi:MAG: hypothetical protein KAR42_03265 [candidate division Zixibacteria bacterium]|nr:hypothetical protein [candidate division Zixibacteria bacterium]
MSIFRDFFTDTGSADKNEPGKIPADEDAILEKVAKKVVDRHMAVPAIIFLESVKPVNYIGAQAMVFFEPIVQSVFVIKDYDVFRRAMERRENMENLLQKIERYDAISYKKEKLYKKKLKEERKNWTWYQRYLGIKQPRIIIDPAELEAIEKKAESKPDDGSDTK